MRVMVGAWAQRGTVYPQSPSCGRDSGVSVFGLAGAPPSPTRSLSRSLSRELLLIKPVCFGRHTLPLSSSPLTPHVHARTHTRGGHTRTPGFVCFGNGKVPLTRASKRRGSAEHTTVFTHVEATPPPHTQCTPV